jgi:hypothetical protein
MRNARDAKTIEELRNSGMTQGRLHDGNSERCLPQDSSECLVSSGGIESHKPITPVVIVDICYRSIFSLLVGGKALAFSPVVQQLPYQVYQRMRLANSLRGLLDHHDTHRNSSMPFNAFPIGIG